jgi:hypothetical protein
MPEALRADVDRRRRFRFCQNLHEIACADVIPVDRIGCGTRHCERSEAIQFLPAATVLDCFAALAMTVNNTKGPSRDERSR